MIKKIMLVVIFFIALLSTYIIFIIHEDRNIIKFAASYIVLKRSNFVPSNKLNPCLFTEMILKNNVKLTCEPFKNICDNKIPITENQINKESACSIITFDVNEFGNVQNKFQVLSYNDGIITIPNSIEHKMLFDKSKSFRVKIQRILSLYDAIDLLKKNK